MTVLRPDTDGTAPILRLGGDTPVLAIWGGVGFSRRPLRDLRDLYSLHGDDLSDFIKHCSNILRSLTAQNTAIDEGSSSSQAKSLRVQQDLAGWLADPPIRCVPTLPPPVIAALTIILQISPYVVLAKRLGMEPGELARCFTAFAGHSSGMVVAVGMAAADSWSSLYVLTETTMREIYYANRISGLAWDQTVQVPSVAVDECVQRGEGIPTPMLSITGTTRSRVIEEIAKVNQTMLPERELYLAVVNTVDAFVVVGGPEGLVQLCARLRPSPQQAISSASSNLFDQHRQDQMCSLQFVPSTAPFHSPHMKAAASLLTKHLMTDSTGKREKVRVPVWGLDELLDGEDLASANSLGVNITNQILLREVDLPAILKPMTGRWQVLDFGPGGFNGISMFVEKMKASSQTKIYIVCPAGIWGQGRLQDSKENGRVLPQLLSTATANPQSYTHVELEPSRMPIPEVERMTSSRFTEALGLPRVLVAGITPTTCDIDLVAAAMNAGFYAELATGDYHDAPTLAAGLRRLAGMIPEGRMITVNIADADTKDLEWIIPELAALVRSGLPIGGLIIGAGMPSARVVADYVETLQLCYLGFKPTTVTEIHRVLDIANEHPTLPVLLQWAGDLTSGRYSLEDFHLSILETYQVIREVNNAILVAASGIGDAQSAWSYISGEWSQRFGRSLMPFDAVLVGSCIMTTQEAKTCPDAKRAMVECPGILDTNSMATMLEPEGAGGIISVMSLHGKPIHVIATRGMRLWAELDTTLFNKSEDAMVEAIHASRSDLIARLNADYQKVWFGWDYTAGGPVDDLGDMTYLDVLRRLVELMHPLSKGGWAHPSYSSIFADFLMRTLERFDGCTYSADLSGLPGPLEQLDAIATRLPECAHYFLSVEDIDYFVAICKRRGQKPVPFIPVLDSEFPVWFKSDALWQFENLSSTSHSDVGRVCIPADPVAIQRCREANLPVGTLLCSIDHGIRNLEAGAGALPPKFYPTAPLHWEGELIQSMGGESQLIVDRDTLGITKGATLQAQDDNKWLLLLGSRLGQWGICAFGAKKLISGGRAYDNPIRRLFAARPGVLVRLSDKNVKGGYARAEMCDDIDNVRIWIDAGTITVTINNRYTVDKTQQEYVLKFAYNESRPYAPLSEIMPGRQDRARNFYWLTLFGGPKKPEVSNPIDIIHSLPVVTREHVIAWQQAINGHELDGSSPSSIGPAGEVPLEFASTLAIEVTWHHLLRLDLDVSKLLHRHTAATLHEGQKMLSVGDSVTMRSQMTSYFNGKSSPEASFRTTVTRNGTDFIDMVHHFVFLGHQVAHSQCFRTTEPTRLLLHLDGVADIQMLRARPWFLSVAGIEPGEDVTGKTLLLDLWNESFWQDGTSVTKSYGDIWLTKGSRNNTMGGKMLYGRIQQTILGSNTADPLASFLKRNAVPVSDRVQLQSERTLKNIRVVTPDNSVEYAFVSRDLNPIHTLPAFARVAGFSGPVYHGSHTVLLALQAIYRTIPWASAAKMRHYNCEFLSVVWPGDALVVTVKHIGMDKGGAVLGFAVRREAGTGESVLTGEVVLEAPPTAFLFTGQGSQFRGMGLDLANESRISRHVWDEADAYFKENWEAGFSMTDIVKRNPTQLTVHFSGVSGRCVRQSYLDAQKLLLTYAPECETGLFEGLGAHSRSYTVSHKDGLLSMTQFAQPALVVVESAAIAHLRQLGHVPPGSQFAGHSLGEFVALSAMTGALPLKAALEAVFIRGMLMQAAVPRDDSGRSGFGMVAIDPSRIGKGCQEEHILEMIRAIVACTGLPLEMVNLNVKGQQYVCAGDKRCLDLLKRVADELHGDLVLSPGRITELVTKHTPSVVTTKANDLTLTRGKATVPLKGIDVPFHSSLLARMAGAFRHTLINSIERDGVRPGELVGKWIPNVVGKTFATDFEYQLSSPVQWIATQATLHESRQHGQRYIEVGPADTLRSMLKKTLAQYPDHGRDEASECLTIGEKLDEINRAAEDELDAAPADSEDMPQVPEAAEPGPVALPSPPVITSPPPPQPRKTLSVVDAPPSAAEVVLAITAFRLRVPRGSIDMTRSIKFLAKGRSALQNEIVGNLAAEFGQLPDAVEDMPLIDLSQDLQRTYGGKFGKFLNGWLAKAVEAKLAPSLTVSKIRSYLSKTFGLQQGRQNSFFLTAGFDEIPSRLGNDQESWQAVSRWAEAYAKDHGLEQMAGPTDPRSDTFGTSGAPSQEAIIADAKLAEFGRDLANLMAKHFDDKSSSKQLQRPGSPQQQTDEPADQNTTHLGNELGQDFINGTRPIFKPEMVYRYLSGWNWAIQDLYVTLSNLVTRAQTEDAREPHLMHNWIDSAHKRLQARATDRMYRCVEYLISKWEQCPASPAKEYCLLLLRQLSEKRTHDASKAHLSLPDMPTRFTAPRTIITEAGDIAYEEVSVTDAHAGSRDDGAPLARPGLGSTASAAAPANPRLPKTQLLTQASSTKSWETNTELTALLHEAEKRFVTKGDSGACGTALVIGAGPRSIGSLIVRRLLEAGCRVALCTSRLTLASRKVIAKLFAEAARPGAELVLLPFNQASIQDIDGIVSYINDTLGWEIDHLVPFAAIPEPRRTIQDIDSLSELAHRAMLTNTLRLMGSIATSKERRHVLNHSTQVLVPLSPNHGQFGSDGLYAESKLALETLLNRWTSEPWSDQLSICAVRIGWTRGTAIMADNDILAEEIEKLGVRTFSALEMATLLTLVMSPRLAEACTLQPVLCDFSGGYQSMPDIRSIRASIQNTVSVKRRLKKEAELDNVSGGSHTAATIANEKRAGLRNPFPLLPEQREIASGGKSQALLDLDSTVVITGFAELGAAGSSRTRWELEAYGEYSLEGCVELAWMTGLIRYVRHHVYEGKEMGPCWIECETGAPIREMDVKSKLEGRIREHTGIRILDPDERHNPDPRLRNMLHEVGTQEDLGPFECSPEAAEALKARHGDAVEVLSNDGVTAMARIRRGVSIFIPKAMNTDFFVGAQVPTGWDGARYGIPPELLTQVDRSTLLVLVCVVEAFLSAGITDIYELYKYMHVSELGNCVGSSAGGGTAAQLFMQQRLLGKEVRSDILGESFVGSASAWVNMLLLSASGPIKTAAGTCATSIESLDTACELIASGRSKMCLVGGHDGFVSSIYYEFGELGALGNAANEARSGREPHEMSRPFTSSRAGFAFGDGVGIQVVCTAALALEMGLPIYGVVAMTHMAGDKLGRSVPAPGRGLLTAAKQSGAVAVPPILLDPSLRAQRIRSSLAHAERRAEEDEAAVRAEAQREGCGPAETEARVQGIREATRLEKKAILRTLAHTYWVGHPGISPIAGALSVFGLGVDDITFASLHGTGTRLNDVNECATLDRQMRHLGRHAGNPVFTVAQKSVVGHGLSAAGAWAINGALQAMHAGLIPGNHNADDIDAELEAFDRLLLANENIAVRPEDMKAFSVTSFGIGQKGAQVLVVHPRYVYAAVDDAQYSAYRAKQVARARVAARALDRVFHGEPLVQAKEETPYVGNEYDFLLDPLARTF
ncbi:acyl transferase domain-containing protein [Xylaria cf. heliscus]|nr:acyl transferase domain-containing protein [Xylaria cf. heliscus]